MIEVYTLNGGGIMLAQVKAWGNGQGVRFSKELLNMIGVHIDEYMDIQVKDGSIILSKIFKHTTLEERAAECQGKIGPYEEYDWGNAEGREQW